MVIHTEFCFHTHHLIFRQFPPYQCTIYLLYSKNFHLLVKLPISLSSKPGTTLQYTTMLHTINHGFCHDITGKMIQPLFPPSSSDHMPEDSVKNQMKIYPIHLYPVFPIQSTQILRMIIQIEAIRSHAFCTFIHDIYQTAQGHIQESHLQIQLISGSLQNLLADHIQFITCC